MTMAVILALARSRVLRPGRQEWTLEDAGRREAGPHLSAVPSAIEQAKQPLTDRKQDESPLFHWDRD